MNCSPETQISSASTSSKCFVLAAADEDGVLVRSAAAKGENLKKKKMEKMGRR